MASAVILVAAYAGGAAAGTAVAGMAALGVYATVAGVVAGAVVGAAIGAVGAAVTGGDVKKTAIMGALAGAAGSYFGIGGGAFRGAAAVSAEKTAELAAAGGVLAPAEVTEGQAITAMTGEGPEAYGVLEPATAAAPATALPPAVTPPPAKEGASETIKVMGGLALAQTAGGYLEGKGTEKSEEKKLQEQQRQSGEMFAGRTFPTASVTNRLNLRERYDEAMKIKTELLNAISVRPESVAPAPVEVS